MGNLSEQPRIFEPKIKKSETQAYIEENLGDFENVEIKKLSELPCWKKISDFIASKKMVGIDNVDTVIANGGKQWESVFGSNDSKSSYKPMTIILKKEIFDNENISDENVSWLIHEIGHIKFYQDLGDKLDGYMAEYHKKGEYSDSEMEKFAFEMQFEYLKSTGKTKGECEDVIRKYLDKSFGEDKKESKANIHKQIMKFLDGIYEADTNIPQVVENENQEEKKRKILAGRRADIDKITDAEGKGIDKEIKDIVVAFNIAGFPTKQSCQGHYGEEKEGWGAPWIQIESPDESEEQFQNQKEIFNRVAKKYGISVGDLGHEDNVEAWSEALREASLQDETREYQEWSKKQHELIQKAKGLLEEFYFKRKVGKDLKLQIADDFVGMFRIYNGGSDYGPIAKDVSDDERNAHKKRLEAYRREMKAFAEFLIDKFMSPNN
jgi:hypothetical protein